MKFKELTQEDKDFIKRTYLDKSIKWDDRMKMLMEYTGKSLRTVQKWVAALNLKEKPDQESPEFKKAKERKFNDKKKRFIIKHLLLSTIKSHD